MNDTCVVPASILAFFIGLALWFGVDGYVNRDYYLEKAKMYTECVHQGMVLDAGDCMPYKKNN